jgi:hypothetical protein
MDPEVEQVGAIHLNTPVTRWGVAGKLKTKQNFETSSSASEGAGSGVKMDPIKRETFAFADESPTLIRSSGVN